MPKLYLLHRFSGRLVCDELTVPYSSFPHGSTANYVKHEHQLLFYPAHMPLEQGTAVFADSNDGRLIAIALSKGGKLPLVGAPLPKGLADAQD